MLVATDCLSEGINLQEHFDAVVHYDLAWNPTRHEQREGRVDRFGQPQPTVRVAHLLRRRQPDRRHRPRRAAPQAQGRSATHSASPSPCRSTPKQVVEAIFEGLLLRERVRRAAEQHARRLRGVLQPQKRRPLQQLGVRRRAREALADRVRPGDIKVEEVARELAGRRAPRSAPASTSRASPRGACSAHGARRRAANGSVEIDLAEVPTRRCEDAIGATEDGPLHRAFELPVRTASSTSAARTRSSRGSPSLRPRHRPRPALARARPAAAASSARRASSAAPRCCWSASASTSSPAARQANSRCSPRTASSLAFAGRRRRPSGSTARTAEALLDAAARRQRPPEQAADFVRQVIDALRRARPQLDADRPTSAARSCSTPTAACAQAARRKGVSYGVEAQLPPDVLGVYVYLPKAS